jgi:hypothetical protein
MYGQEAALELSARRTQRAEFEFEEALRGTLLTAAVRLARVMNSQNISSMLSVLAKLGVSAEEALSECVTREGRAMAGTGVRMTVLALASLRWLTIPYMQQALQRTRATYPVCTRCTGTND